MTSSDACGLTYALSDTDKDKFSLHDCRAKKVVLDGNLLTFVFPDGIFFEEYGDDWPNTGPAELAYATEGGVSVYLFEDMDGYEIRTAYTIEQLADKVNSGEWELEFAYQYDGFHEVFHTGWIWQEHEPWSRECQLFIGIKQDAVYRWNPPAAERKD